MPINKSAGWNDLQIGLFISSLPRTHLTNNLACHEEYHLNRADNVTYAAGFWTRRSIKGTKFIMKPSP